MRIEKLFVVVSALLLLLPFAYGVTTYNYTSSTLRNESNCHINVHPTAGESYKCNADIYGVDEDSTTWYRRSYVMYPLNITLGTNIASETDILNARWISIFDSFAASPQNNIGIYYVNSTWEHKNLADSWLNWSFQPCGNTVGSLSASKCNTTAMDSKTPSGWSSGQRINWNVTDALRRAVREGRTNVTWVIFNGENQPTDRATNFKSTENPAPADHPYLEISFVEALNSLPQITSYNMTSEGGAGCTNWNTNKGNACSTTDTTPTVYFVTDVAANCAIGITNSNHSDLGYSRNCTGGEATTLHTCTLTSQDELTYEDSYVYIGCKGSNEIQNTTSTSGGLAIQITGLSSGASSAIGRGVQNALLSGYANYTNQQIYAVNLAGAQDFGTFDWVAKKGTKTWALNYVSQGESHIGLFNLTPVLYVLEMSNATNSTITNLVEAMINATK